MSDNRSGRPDAVFWGLRMGALGMVFSAVLLLLAAWLVRSGTVETGKMWCLPLLALLLGGVISGALCRGKGNRGWIALFVSLVFAWFLCILLQSMVPGNPVSFAAPFPSVCALMLGWIISGLLIWKRKRQKE